MAKNNYQNKSFILIIFQLQCQVPFLFFLETVCHLGLTHCIVLCSPGSYAKIWFLNCCGSPEGSVLLERQIINGRRESFEENLHPYVIDVLRNGVCCPLFFALLFRKIKFANWMTPECGLSPVNHRVMPPNSY